MKLLFFIQIKDFKGSSSNTWNLEPSLEITYIFMDDIERKKFAQITHEYLI